MSVKKTFIKKIKEKFANTDVKRSIHNRRDLWIMPPSSGVIGYSVKYYVRTIHLFGIFPIYETEEVYEFLLFTEESTFDIIRGDKTFEEMLELALIEKKRQRKIRDERAH